MHLPGFWCVHHIDELPVCLNSLTIMRVYQYYFIKTYTQFHVLSLNDQMQNYETEHKYKKKIWFYDSL